MFADAREGGVGVLLAGIARAQIVAGEQKFNALVFGRCEVTILIHAEDKEIEQCGLLFVRKTLCVHGEMVGRGKSRVNLRKNGWIITISEDFRPPFGLQLASLFTWTCGEGWGCPSFARFMAGTGMDIKYVAHLARLALTPEEEEKLGAQLGNILHYIEKLNQLDVSNVEPTSHAVPLVNVTREDAVRPSLSNEEALRNAPSKANGLFLVPKIVE